MAGSIYPYIFTLTSYISSSCWSCCR